MHLDVAQLVEAHTLPGVSVLWGWAEMKHKSRKQYIPTPGKKERGKEAQGKASIRRTGEHSLLIGVVTWPL